VSRAAPRPPSRTRRVARLVGLAALAAVGAALAVRDARAQKAPDRQAQRAEEPPVTSAETTVVRASTRYRAGRLRRALLGSNYRDLWETPIRVPVLDLASYAGGLTPLEEGGNAQTKNLRLGGRDGREYVFRPVFKERMVLVSGLEGTLAVPLVADQLSASHPAATVMAPPLLEAVGVLHPTPILVQMPDDEALGEFRKDFAGKLGTIEAYPTVPQDAPGFANAVDIIDSEDLLERINEDPSERVDARRFLAARLVDLLLNDNDRHAGQWKWARLTKGSAWVPIARDRDKVLVSHEGLLLRLARVGAPKLVTFDSAYGNVAAMFGNARELDRRLLSGLSREAWDSVASGVARAATDSVLDAVVRAQPREYHGRAPELAGKLRARRDRLRESALRYYETLFRVVDIHATDAADRATVTRTADGVVQVQLSSGGDPPYFATHFDRRYTSEIRLYLHGGDDTATVTGAVASSIPLRIIGGNGRNSIGDSSTVGGRPAAVRLYDRGAVDGVRYAADTVNGEGYLPDTAFNRRPWLRHRGDYVPPEQDYGTRTEPVAGLVTGRSLGVVPRVGFRRYRLGFRTLPYASMLQVDAAYSTRAGGYELRALADHRLEGSRLHWTGEARVSQLAVIEFHGLGNDVPDLTRDAFFDVRQTQHVINPAAAWSLGRSGDVAVGPVVKYVATVAGDGPATFVTSTRPYGFGHFTQAGLRLDWRHDTRDAPGYATRGVEANVGGTFYPSLLDVREPFGRVEALASTYVRLPLGKRSVLALRAGGEKVFGTFPFYEAAFIGTGALRSFRYHQYAGDASVYGSTELRIPVGRLPVLPLELGLLGFGDAGRVFVDGRSPGGWHTVVGAGAWLGLLSPATSVSVSLTSRPEQRFVFGTGVSF
jgi:hypothetical protein